MVYMRVAFDHQAFSTQPYGGISRYFVELVSNLHSSSLCTPKIFSPLFTNNYIKSYLQDTLYSGFYCKSFKGSTKLLPFLNRLLSPLAISKFCPDIIHHTFFDNFNYSSSSAKHVVTVYDMVDELLPHLYPYQSRSKSLIYKKKKVIAKADHIFSISHNTKQDLLKLYNISPSKISVVHLGFSLPKPNPLPLYNLPHPFILYVGPRYKYKNFNGAVEAFLSHQTISRDFNFVSFGGAPFTSSELHFFNSFSTYNNNVFHFAGDDTLLSFLYSQASLFVYPSFYEGFGIPPLEAMSMGCPVVCSNSSCLPEINGDAVCYFDPYSVQSIRSAFESVLFSSSYQSHLISLGYKQSSKYSFEQCAHETYRVYQSVLS